MVTSVTSSEVALIGTTQRADLRRASVIGRAKQPRAFLTYASDACPAVPSSALVMYRIFRSSHTRAVSSVKRLPLIDAAVLEPRLLFNAAPLAALLPSPTETMDATVDFSPLFGTEADTGIVDTVSAPDARSDTSSRLELVFVDAGVADYQTLIEDIRQQSNDSELTIYLLNPKDDGIEQITDILSERATADGRAVDAVHVVSHGNDAALRLGNSILDGGTLDGYASLLASWREHLSSDADVLLYGCDVAGTSEGRTLVDGIGALTGADVAASIDDSGASRHGGDWDLEYRVGLVDSTSLLRNNVASSWQGLLATPEIRSTDETLASIPASRIQDIRAPHHAVAVDGVGNSVIVWTDHYIDGDGTGIALRRFNSSGDPVGSVSQINVNETGNQASAVVAADASGRFVVAWVSADDFGTGIYLRRFDASGHAIDSGDILVNAGMQNGAQDHVSLAVNDNNQIVLAWDSTLANQGIHARTFDFTTVLPGTELNTTLLIVDTESTATNPAVDINANGRFVITWNDPTSVWARKYAFGSDSALGAKLRLDGGVGVHSQSAVAVLPNNDYAVVVRSDIVAFSGVWGRIIHDDDTMGGPVLVSDPSMDGTAPAIAMDASGDFVVTFSDSDADQSGVYFRVFDSEFTPSTAIQQANQSTDGVQNNASVAMHDTENFIVVWSGSGDRSGQTDSEGIFYRQYGSLNNSAPVAWADTGSPYSINDGDTLVLDGTASSDANGDPLTFAWDLDNDGIYGESGEPTTASASVAWATLNAFGIAAPGTYTIGLRVQDDLGGVSNANTTVTVINVVPTVTNASQTIGYTEGDATVDIGDIIVSDPNTNDVITVTLTNQHPATGVLSTGTYGASASTYDHISGRWRVSGTIADVNAALADTAFEPTSDNDTITQIVVQLVDASGNGPTDGLIQLNATAVNDPPRVDLDTDDSGSVTGAGYQTDFMEGGGPVLIADPTDALIDDIDNASLDHLRVEIQNPLDGAAEVLSADTSGTSLTATFSAGRLMVSGNDTLAAYQRVLRTVRYNNTSVAPDTTSRTLVVTANDGLADSTPAQITIAVQAVNQTPSLTHPATFLAAENSRSLLSGLAVADVDIGSGHLRFELRVEQGTLTFNPAVAGGLEADQIQGNGTSSVTVNAPLSAINTSLSSSNGLIYQGNVDFAGTDRLTLQLSDTLSDTAATVAIDVVAENNPPVARDDDYVTTLNETLSVATNGLLSNDSEPEDQMMSVILVSAPSSGTLTLQADGGFRFTPSASSPEVVTFSYAVNDGTNTSGPATVTITVQRPITAVDIQSSSASVNQDTTKESKSDSDDTSKSQSDDSQQTQEETLAPITEVVKDAVNRKNSNGSSVRETIESGESEAGTSGTPSTQSSQRNESEQEDVQDNASIQNDMLTQAHQRQREGYRPALSNVTLNPFESQVIWNDFAELQEQITEVVASPYVFAGQFVGVTSALSVGYVLWTIRSGLLATSLLAHLPAWTVVDPLLVLTDLDGDDGDDDDDSLEGMLGKNDREQASNEQEPPTSESNVDGAGDQD